MSLNRRLVVGSLLLAAGIGMHQALLWHLAPVRNARASELSKPLASLPMQFQLPSDYETRPEAVDFRTWQGIDHPARAEVLRQVPFADELLLRAYHPNAPGPTAVLYAVYSRQGEDRNHHPEICVRDVQGAIEDVANRQVIHLAGNADRPVQRFRFQTGTNSFTVIYYWHYELSPPLKQELSALQQVYQRHGPRPPSVTVQVTTLAPLDQLESVEASFLVCVDRKMRETALPAGVTMACDRLPITLIRR